MVCIRGADCVYVCNRCRSLGMGKHLSGMEEGRNEYEIPRV